METRKVINNAKWIIVCKVAQSVLQLIIGMLTARYLGPSDYGLVNYAKSLVAFMLPVVHLGLNSTLIQELIDCPENQGEILGTSLAMSFVSALVSLFAVAAFVTFANKGEAVTLRVCTIYGLSVIFQSAELLQYWFHSRLASKQTSLIALISYISVSAYKIYLLMAGKSIYWFAAVSSVEYGITATLLLLAYNKNKAQKLRVSYTTGKRLFSKSKYYIIAAFMVTVFQNTDHIMLKIMAGDTENGMYSAAVTCCVMAQFIYLAIIDSVRPVILENKKKDKAAYEKSISALYCIIVYMALCQAAAFTLFANSIIHLLYGSAYTAAVTPLKILIWHFIFSCIGVIRNIWILAEEKHSILWKINLAGATGNIILNALFITRYGASGAALASVVTQCFTNVILGFIYSPLKDNNRLLLRGLKPTLLADIYIFMKQFITNETANE